MKTDRALFSLSCALFDGMGLIIKHLSPFTVLLSFRHGWRMFGLIPSLIVSMPPARLAKTDLVGLQQVSVALSRNTRYQFSFICAG
jgi:hypothetical protein